MLSCFNNDSICVAGSANGPGADETDGMGVMVKAAGVPVGGGMYVAEARSLFLPRRVDETGALVVDIEEAECFRLSRDDERVSLESSRGERVPLPLPELWYRQGQNTHTDRQRLQWHHNSNSNTTVTVQIYKG
jgi:hypothetical protein